MLLSAPKPASLEVAGDLNGFMANFWRAVKYQPGEVARSADYPISHIDMGARHKWLMNQRKRLSDSLQDAEWPGDAKVAGRWLWGQCLWIGAGWCDWFDVKDWSVEKGPIPSLGNAGAGVSAKGQIPFLSNAGQGVQGAGGKMELANAGQGVQAIGKIPSQKDCGCGIHAVGGIPHLTDAGNGIHAVGGIPQVNETGRGVNAIGRVFSESEKSLLVAKGRAIPDDLITYSGQVAWIWMHKLAERLNRVRLIHGEWTRCMNHYYGGTETAIFFDPPYKGYESVYGGAIRSADAVEVWSREHQDIRIALCGHIGDYDLPGWEVFQWNRGSTTFGSSKTIDQECIWFSPACLSVEAKQRSLF
jgi:hypothetical protein